MGASRRTGPRRPAGGPGPRNRGDKRRGGLLLRAPSGRRLIPARTEVHQGSCAPRYGQARRSGERSGPARTGLPPGPLSRHGNDRARRRHGNGGLSHRPGLVRVRRLRHAAALRPGLRGGKGNASAPQRKARGKGVSRELQRQSLRRQSPVRPLHHESPAGPPFGPSPSRPPPSRPAAFEPPSRRPPPKRS